MNKIQTLIYAALPMICMATAATAVTPDTQNFSSSDIPRIVEVSRANEMRFNRDYRGGAFIGVMPLARIHERMFSEGTYMVEFGSGGFGGNVDCDVSDKSTIDRLTDWTAGQMIGVKGVIRTTILGDLELEDCTYESTP